MPRTLKPIERAIQTLDDDGVARIAPTLTRRQLSAALFDTIEFHSTRAARMLRERARTQFYNIVTTLLQAGASLDYERISKVEKKRVTPRHFVEFKYQPPYKVVLRSSYYNGGERAKLEGLFRRHHDNPRRIATRKILNDLNVPNDIAQKILHLSKLTNHSEFTGSERNIEMRRNRRSNDYR